MRTSCRKFCDICFLTICQKNVFRYPDMKNPGSVANRKNGLPVTAVTDKPSNLFETLNLPGRVPDGFLFEESQQGGYTPASDSLKRYRLF